MTFIHSPQLMASKLPTAAMAAPVRPAIREWLCDVGMPKNHAAAPQTMMATMAAASAARAAWLSPPKSTILKMVLATALVNTDTTSRPRKLHTAAMTMAGRGFIERVDTTVAMALGASVAPLTTMTATLSKVTASIRGSLTTPIRKVPNSTVTDSSDRRRALRRAS